MDSPVLYISIAQGLPHHCTCTSVQTIQVRTDPFLCIWKREYDKPMAKGRSCDAINTCTQSETADSWSTRVPRLINCKTNGAWSSRLLLTSSSPLTPVSTWKAHVSASTLMMEVFLPTRPEPSGLVFCTAQDSQVCRLHREMKRKNTWDLQILEKRLSFTFFFFGEFRLNC